MKPIVKALGMTFGKPRLGVRAVHFCRRQKRDWLNAIMELNIRRRLLLASRIKVPFSPHDVPENGRGHCGYRSSSRITYERLSMTNYEVCSQEMDFSLTANRLERESIVNVQHIIGID